MAKLVDALCSGRSARKGVLVRIQFWAQSSAFAELFYCRYDLLCNPDKLMPATSVRKAVTNISVFFTNE